jgi:prevent-host-death family protein
MKIATVAAVKAQLNSYLKASTTGPVVVTRKGKAVAVLLGVENDEELERLLLAHSRKLRAILEAADRRIEEGAGIGHEAFWQQVESATRAREENGSRKKHGAKSRGRVGNRQEVNPGQKKKRGESRIESKKSNPSAPTDTPAD